MVCPNTSETTVVHHITVDNVKNEEILNYSLLIFKGHIENAKFMKCIPPPHILIKTAHDENPRQTIINTENNVFKFIIDLKPGSNFINLFYCCTSTNITLNHQRLPTNLHVMPLYIICEDHDGNFQAPESEGNASDSACKRIMTGCKLIQSLFAEKLYESGFGRKTFQLESSNCHIFRSRLNFEKANRMSQLELWYYFAREIMSSSIASSDRKYVAFLSCTKYNGSGYSRDMKEHGEVVRLTEGYVAFGGEGLALLGTHCLYTWPESVLEVEDRFMDNSVVDATRFMDDSCYRGTLGGCFSTTLGATVHELCHTFNLGHTENGIMGSGFDNIQNIFLSNQEKLLPPNRDSRIMVRYRSSFKKNCYGQDDTYWTESCLVLLKYHRWFNNFHTRRKFTLHYDATSKIIKSTAGLRVVEIRRETDEMVLKYWVFTDKVLKYSYQITDELQGFNGNTLLFVEDNNGNILKQKF